MRFRRRRIMGVGLLVAWGAGLGVLGYGGVASGEAQEVAAGEPPPGVVQAGAGDPADHQYREGTPSLKVGDVFLTTQKGEGAEQSDPSQDPSTPTTTSSVPSPPTTATPGG